MEQNMQNISFPFSVAAFSLESMTNEKIKIKKNNSKSPNLQKIVKNDQFG